MVRWLREFQRPFSDERIESPNKDTTAINAYQHSRLRRNGKDHTDGNDPAVDRSCHRLVSQDSFETQHFRWRSFSRSEALWSELRRHHDQYHAHDAGGKQILIPVFHPCGSDLSLPTVET